MTHEQTVDTQTENLQLVTAAKSVAAQARDLVVVDEQTAAQGADLATALSRKAKELEERRNKLKKPILEAGRQIDDLFKPTIDALETSARDVKRAIVRWRDEEQRRAQVAAEEERKRREEEERLARDREAKALADVAAANALASEAATAGDLDAELALEEERLALEQKAAELAADTMRAAVNAAAPLVHVGSQAATAKTIRGTSGAALTFAKRWDYRLEDIAKVPAQFLELNRGAVRAAVNGGAREIPGLVIFQTEDPA